MEKMGRWRVKMFINNRNDFNPIGEKNHVLKGNKEAAGCRHGSGSVPMSISQNFENLFEDTLSCSRRRQMKFLHG